MFYPLYLEIIDEMESYNGISSLIVDELLRQIQNLMDSSEDVLVDCDIS